MVSTGAILTGLDSPFNSTCISQIWFVSFGYTLQLVPLLVKVAAINKLMQAAQRMRRVKLQRGSLHGGVVIISLLVTFFLIAWTVIDPPQKQAHYELTDRRTASPAIVEGHNATAPVTGDLIETTIVQARYYCTSDSEAWQFVAIGWNFVLILCATALAFQSRTVKQAFNEAQVLSWLIYGHFMFVLLRVMAHFFRPAVSVPMLSMIFSLDTIFMIGIYFIPKLLADDSGGVDGEGGSTFFSGAFSSRFAVVGGNSSQVRSDPGSGEHSSHAFTPSTEFTLPQPREPVFRHNSNVPPADGRREQSVTNCLSETPSSTVVDAFSDGQQGKESAISNDADPPQH